MHNDTNDYQKRRAEALKHLNKEKAETIRFLVVLFLITIVCAYFYLDTQKIIFAIGAGIAAILFFAILLNDVPKIYRQFKKLDTNLLELEQEIKDVETHRREFDEKLAQQSAEADARLKAQKEARHAYDHPECPMCKSHNTRRISTANRAVSVATVGLASSKIGKQYECFNCKHKW